MSSTIKLCNSSQFDSHIELIPSTKIYFYEYPYKVDIKGHGYPHPDYDPDLQYEITDFMKSCNMFYKREYQSSSGRSIYLGSYDDLMWLTNWMSHHVKAVHGPISDLHLSYLQSTSTVLREKLFYNNYNYRIEFAIRRRIRWPGSYIIPSEPSDRRLDNLVDFVSQNFDDYRWSTTSFGWYYNYLYCNKSEFDEVNGFLTLSFKDIITKQTEIKLFSEL